MVEPKFSPGEWEIERRKNYQGFGHLVGAEIVARDVIVAEVRGAIEIDGMPCEEIRSSRSARAS